MSLNNYGSTDSSLPEHNDPALEREMLEMKLRAEFGMLDSFTAEDIPPELHRMFLQQVYDFEKNVASGHAPTFAESLLLPAFEPWPEEGIPWEKAEGWVENVLQCYREQNVEVVFRYDYPAAVRYNFLTQFLPGQPNFFGTRPGIVTPVIYEDFMPNHIETIEENTRKFMDSFFGLDAGGLKDVLWREQLSLDEGPYDGLWLIEYFENLFASLSGFEKHDFTIIQSGYELNLDNETELQNELDDVQGPIGFGYAEGMVGYIANSFVKSEPIRMVGPFKFYFEYREGHWGIMYPQFPGLKVPPTV